MKTFIMLGLLLTKSIFAADGCGPLSKPVNICQINPDRKQAFFNVNRPGQSICFLRLITSTERIYISSERLKRLNDKIGVRWVLAPADAGEVKDIPFEIRDDLYGRPGYYNKSALYISTGKAFGFSGVYKIFSKTNESLKSIFASILEATETDIVAFQPVICGPYR